MSNELAVITKAKDLCDYVLTVTDKSPKKFRFALVIRLQNYSLDVLENLLSANDVPVKDFVSSRKISGVAKSLLMR